MPRRNTDPLVAIGYIRVSTTEQHLGQEAQRADVERFAARQGLTVVEWFTDAGVSGAADLDARPGLLAALAGVRRLGASSIIVAKRDRLARDPVICALVERSAEKLGARLVSADGLGNGDGPGDELVRGILDVVSRFERRLIGARTKSALGALRAAGKRAGNTPFGYCAGEGGVLVECPRERQIVERVGALRASGLSFETIAESLNREGFVSRSGTPVGRTQVVRIVRANGRSRSR